MRMVAIVEECFHVARSAVVSHLVDERNAIRSKLHLIRSLYGDEGLSDEAIRRINELSKQLTEITEAEYLVCYELNALRKDAESLVKNHSY